MSGSRLFQPLQIGNMTVQHRIAMAPLTRYRADDAHVPTALQLEYYRQRASVPGTLLITEATFMSAKSGGYRNVPGIYTDAQIAAWKKITDAVHARGSFLVCQLWALGRAARQEVADEEGFRIKSSSAVPIGDGYVVPEAMTVDEIRQTVADYATAARNAIAAGFDAVEVHGANGYLVDQFIQDTCNRRTDEYGGSVENRSRFAVEVVDAVVAAVGAERTAIRLSPWTTFQGMRMADPVPQFSDVIRKIGRHRLAYVHVVRSGIYGNRTIVQDKEDSLDFVVDLFNGPVLIAGDLDAESARDLVDRQYPDKDVVATFGRYFISTPDLPFRVREGIPLNPYDANTFYFRGSPIGYIDQPFSKEFEAKYGVQIQQANL
ncbi:hypothetical protein QBC47DRAFT_389971 [Echria macrotheca]|uniref:NADH:flavin oxidoreductase/NADH oxidase N-terminal domain-containing protein n=1 Tax=Echria macrotheca TaxID=438768 RepID=A0AAJ0B5T3_9PEZI|nr:hypothetical protein QBC47DRAFT_389971 [Echria macrotheca]